MELRGWDYTGRNIGTDLHRQLKIMVDCLSDMSFVGSLAWGTTLQEKLAKEIGVSSSGAVRTVKKMCDNFGIFLPSALSSRETISPDRLLSQRGKIIYQAATLEMQIVSSDGLSKNIKQKALEEVKHLYEEAYCEALLYYHFENPDGTYFYPLRATIKALRKYKSLDKWEWYLLNTFIRHNDDSEEEAVLDSHIELYRKGLYTFTMENVTEKPKGHQYIPQYFEFAGLVNIVQRPNWRATDNQNHLEIKDQALTIIYENIKQGD